MPLVAPSPASPGPAASGRVRFREEVELRAAEAEPGAREREVRRPRHLLEPERAGVEAA